MIPCRRDLRVGFVCSIVWGSCLEPVVALQPLKSPGALACAPAALHREARWFWCGASAPVFSLPTSPKAKCCRQCGCELPAMVLPWTVLPSTRWLFPTHVAPTGLPDFLAFSIQSLSPIRCQKLFMQHSAVLPVPTYIQVYLLMGGGEFSVLCCRHLGPWDE